MEKGRSRGIGLPGRRSLAALAVVLPSLVFAASAMAGWAGANPSSNFKAAPLPAACSVYPKGAACINAGVYYLDRARARLNQKPYKLPGNFAKLAPDRQVFILSNLDRVHYGLAPITGLTHALDVDALGGRAGDAYGVVGDGDPNPTSPQLPEFTSNWAGGFPNIVLAYEAWMYNDGLGSGNIDCPTAASPGCWGHRHDVLWKFLDAGPSAMGAAAGKDRKGVRSYAIILAKGTGAYKPSYIYTWSQAKAAGAGTHTYTVHKPSATGSHGIRIGSVTPSGNAIVVHIKAPAGVPLKCQWSHQASGSSKWVTVRRYKACGTVVKFTPRQRSGKYRIRAKSPLGTASAIVTF